MTDVGMFAGEECRSEQYLNEEGSIREREFWVDLNEI